MPIISDPAPKSPGPQRSVAEMRAQTIELLQETITAIGLDEEWFWTRHAREPWDGDTAWTRMSSCQTVGEKGSWQATADAFHDPIAKTPRQTARIFTDYWETRGFTTQVTIDGDTVGGMPMIQLRALREDGTKFSLMVNTEVIAMHALSECSTHWSVQYRIDHRTDPPVEPPHTPAG